MAKKNYRYWNKEEAIGKVVSNRWNEPDLIFLVVRANLQGVYVMGTQSPIFVSYKTLKEDWTCIENGDMHEPCGTEIELQGHYG